MDFREGPRDPAPDAGFVVHDADVAQVVGATVEACQEIGAALRPIIGPRGVGALYARSLHLAGSSHPWLAELHKGDRSTMDLEALEAVLARQESAEARTGGAALLRTLHEVLASLIGHSLADKLLHRVRLPHSGGSPAQDTSR